MLKYVLLTIGFLLILVDISAAGDRSTFRAIDAKPNGKNVEIELAIEQGPDSIPLDFYAHKTCPGHRNVEGTGVPVTSGRKLGSVTPPGRQTTMHTFTVDLADLGRDPGVQPGGTLHIALKSPGYGDNGGHEWGVNSGPGATPYNKETSVVLPKSIKGAKNSSLRRKKQQPPKKLDIDILSPFGRLSPAARHHLLSRRLPRSGTRFGYSSSSRRIR